jgi:hypothetical protein
MVRNGYSVHRGFTTVDGTNACVTVDTVLGDTVGFRCVAYRN